MYVCTYLFWYIIHKDCVYKYNVHTYIAIFNITSAYGVGRTWYCRRAHAVQMRTRTIERLST